MLFLNLLRDAITGLASVFIGPQVIVGETASRSTDSSRRTAVDVAAAREAAAGSTPNPKRLAWSDQAWLAHNLQRLSGFVADGNYVKFKDLDIRTNGAAITSFLKLRPQELSLLQPHIQLYRIDPKTGTPLVYPISVLPENVAYDAAFFNDRLNYTTIKSVSIDRTGKFIEFQNLKVKVELFASSYAAFAQKRNGVSLLDFLKRPRRKKGMPRDVGTPRDHMMRMTVGWSDPTGKTLNDYSPTYKADLVVFAQKSKLTLNGALLSHDISFQQDGSMKITLTYQGVLDTLLNSPRANILFTPGGDAYKKFQGTFGTLDSLNATENQRKLAAEKLKEERESLAKEAYSEILAEITRLGGLYYTVVKGVDQLTLPPNIRTHTPTNSFSAPVRVSGDPPSNDDEATKRIIKFFPLGELIKFFGDNALGKQRKQGQIPKNQSLQIFVGNINWSLGGKIYEQNMGNLPVCLELFQQWFVKFLTGQKRVEIPLQEFLSQMLRGLVKSVFANFGEIPLDTPRTYRTQFQLHLQAHKGAEKLLLSAKTTAGRLHRISAPEFKLGGSQAVIKKFSFSRVNIKSYATAQLSANSLDDTSIARQMYRINLEVFGTAMFSNGMLIKINPAGLFMGATDQLGFGGYYVIHRTDSKWSPQGYFTNLQAIWNSPLQSSKEEAKIYTLAAGFFKASLTPNLAALAHKYNKGAVQVQGKCQATVIPGAEMPEDGTAGTAARSTPNNAPALADGTR